VAFDPEQFASEKLNVTPGAQGNPLYASVDKAAEDNDIPKEIFHALVKQESNYNPSAKSIKGAQGLTQLMPATAEELGVDPSDPVQNLHGGATYLKKQHDQFGDWNFALAAYNAGPGNVQKAIKKAGSSNFEDIAPYLPSETQNYVKKITGNAGLQPSSPAFDPEAFANQQLGGNQSDPEEVKKNYTTGGALNRNSPLTGAMTGILRNSPVPENLAGGLVRMNLTDPIMNAIKAYQTGQIPDTNPIESFKKGYGGTKQAVSQANELNPISSTAAGMIPQAAMMATGGKALGMVPTGEATALENLANIVKSGAINTATQQVPRGLNVDPSQSLKDFGWGMGGEAANIGVNKLSGDLPENLMNKALGTPAKSLEKGSTVGKEALEKGMWGTRKGMLKSGLKEYSKIGDQLDEALSKVPESTKMDDNLVLKELEDLKGKYLGTRGQEGSAEVVQKEIDKLKARPDFGNLTAKEATDMKQKLYSAVGEPGYLKDTHTAKMAADMAQARGLKNAVESVVPEAKGINKELGFYKQVTKNLNKKIAKVSTKDNSLLGHAIPDVIMQHATGIPGMLAYEAGRLPLTKTIAAEVMYHPFLRYLIPLLANKGEFNNSIYM
jgi:hypothetical protein